jgi:CRP-like cAMP-binding protein
VPGAAKLFKPGDTVFKAGDQPDGMYIVRKGELQVVLEKEGKQVVLATINEGGIVGEMALFDKQNRSATVKASKPSEVTLITLGDFEGLLKQIPKWFVTLMGALSSRLRLTNERLQKAEAGGVKPMQSALRMIAVMDLAWAKHGEKDDKGKVVIHTSSLEQVLIDTLQESQPRVESFLKILVENEVLKKTIDSRKIPSWSMPNRAFVKLFPEFLTEFDQAKAPVKCLDEKMLKVLEVAINLAQKNPYDPALIPFAEIAGHLKIEESDLPSWQAGLQVFRHTGKACELVKSGDGTETIKVIKTESTRLVKFHRILTSFINQSF